MEIDTLLERLHEGCDAARAALIDGTRSKRRIEANIKYLDTVIEEYRQYMLGTINKSEVQR